MTYRLVDDIMYTLDIRGFYMKKTKIDRLGRIVIPIQYRKELGLTEDSVINIECVDGRVIITSSDSVCRICGGYVNGERDIPICKSCIARVKKL